MSTGTFVNPLLATPEDQERSERARRAYAVAQKQLSGWQAFARMLTRNDKIVVKLTGGTPCTDGETIWLRVPIELGDELEHNNKLCGTRDPDSKRMKCHACDVLDGIDCTQQHETSHITSDSFQSMTQREIVDLLGEAIRIEAEGLPDSARGKKIQRRYEAMKPYNFIMAANLISPWLGIILNAVEDARVNEERKQARVGTVVQFQAQTNKIFEEGIEQMDGTRARWDEQPLNMQAVIGLYCKVSSLDYSKWLAPEIVAALDDPEIEDITLRTKTARSVGTCFRMSIRFLEALRRLGYCKTEEDVEDDPKPTEPGKPGDEKGEGEGEGGSSDSDSDGESGDDGEAGGSAGGTGAGAGGAEDGEPDTKPDAGDDDTSDDTDGADSGAKEDDEGEPDSGDASSGNTSGQSDESEQGEWDGSNPERVKTEETEPLPMGDPDEAARGLAIFGRHSDDGSVDQGNTPDDEEALNKAIVQADYFDAPSNRVYGVNVHKDNKDGEAWTGESFYSRADTSPIKLPETILSPALMRLRRAFQANARGGYQRDKKTGRVDARVLGRRVLTDDYRWFKKRVEPAKRDHFVYIELDVSGSTARPGVIDLTKRAAFAKAELCQRLGVKFAVYAHTGITEAGKGLMLDMYEIKSPKGRWDDAAKQRLFNLRPAAANLDGHTLEFARKVTQSVPATDKIILYYTDGALPAENYDEELSILVREIDTLKKLGIKLVGIGIRNNDPEKFGLDTIRLDTIEDVPRVVTELEKRLKA